MDPMAAATSADWTIAGGTIALTVVTLLVVIVALFQDQLRSFLRAPKLDATIDMARPDCLAIPMQIVPRMTTMAGVTSIYTGSTSAPCYYYRIRVWNRGNASARHVEVMGTELRKRTATGGWQFVPEFLPMNFVWSNTGERLIVYPQVMSESFKHCDIGHIVDPASRSVFGEDNPTLGLSTSQVSMALDQTVAPTNYAHIIGPGEYQLDIAIAADNARTVRKTLNITITGTWSVDEAKMLSTHTGVRIS